MAYNLDHLTKLQHLKDLAERAEKAYAKQTDLDALKEEVKELEQSEGQDNVIEKIKVNGKEQEIEDKTVDITVPEKVSELENDLTFQTEDEVLEAIEKAIAESGTACFKLSETVPDPAEAEENVLYLVMNEQSGNYDIYALVDGEMVLLGDTSVNLADYVTTEDMETAIADFIKLTDLDYTDDGDGNVVTAVTYDKATGVFTVTKGITAIEESDIATDEEVEEMLDEIYGVA